jgi:hypothetical protein
MEFIQSYEVIEKKYVEDRRGVCLMRVELHRCESCKTILYFPGSLFDDTLYVECVNRKEFDDFTIGEIMSLKLCHG